MKKFSTLFFFAILFVGCSSIDKTDSENPEEIYQAATTLIKEEDYFAAREHIEAIKKRFPQSRFAYMADLRTADIEFAEENFTEAAAMYGVFVDLHPRHEEADYALFRKAKSFFLETPSRIARDQTPCLDAVAAAKLLLNKYPNSKYRAETATILFDARLKLAQKEAYIARFYERKEALDSANRRWLKILSTYADLEDQNNEDAKELIKKAKDKVAAYAKINSKGG